MFSHGPDVRGWTDFEYGRMSTVTMETPSSSDLLPSEFACKVCNQEYTKRPDDVCKTCRKFYSRYHKDGFPTKCRFKKNCQIPEKELSIRKCGACRFELCVQAGLKDEADERAQRQPKRPKLKRPDHQPIRHTWDLDPVTGTVIYPEGYNHNGISPDEQIRKNTQSKKSKPKMYPGLVDENSLSPPGSSVSSSWSSPEYAEGLSTPYQQATDNQKNEVRRRESYQQVLNSLRGSEQELQPRPSVLQASRQHFDGLLKGTIGETRGSQSAMVPAVVPDVQAQFDMADDVFNNGDEETADNADNNEDEDDNESLLFDELGFLDGENFDEFDGDLGEEIQNLENMNPEDLEFTEDFEMAQNQEYQENQIENPDDDVMITGEHQFERNENLNIPMHLEDQMEDDDVMIVEERRFTMDQNMNYQKQTLQNPQKAREDLDPWLQEHPEIDSFLEPLENRNQPAPLIQKPLKVQKPVKQLTPREILNQQIRQLKDMYLKIENDRSLNDLEKFIDRQALDQKLNQVLAQERSFQISQDHDYIGNTSKPTVKLCELHYKQDIPTIPFIIEDPFAFIFDKELMPIPTQEQFQKITDSAKIGKVKKLVEFLGSLDFLGTSINGILAAMMKQSTFPLLEANLKLCVFYHGFLAVHLLDMMYAQLHELVTDKSVDLPFRKLLCFDSGKIYCKCDNFFRALRMRKLHLGEREYRFMRTIVMFDKFPDQEVWKIADRAKAAWKDYEQWKYPIEVLEHCAEFTNNYLIYRRTEGHVGKSKCKIAVEVIGNLMRIDGIASF